MRKYTEGNLEVTETTNAIIKKSINTVKDDKPKELKAPQPTMQELKDLLLEILAEVKK